MSASLNLDLMVCNHTEIDWDVFNMWLDGPVEGICINQIKDGYDDPNLSQEIVQSDLQNNFRLFVMLEPILHQPTMFSEQLVWQMQTSTQEQLISRYYALDNSVARELLGRKLSGRLRKDLDEITEKTGISLKSCRRQFDNIKRIFKAVEEMPGRLIYNITSLFSLNDDLAIKYGVIIFIGVHRFETTKKKLAAITFKDIITVTQAIMQNWTSGMDIDESGDPVLDRDYFGGLRELKMVQDREKEHRNIFIKHLAKSADKRLVSDMETHFKPFNRNVISIGSTLYHNKEIRDIFLNVWEKIVEPLKQLRFSLPEVRQIVDSYEEILTDNRFLIETDMKNNFVRFFATLKVMIVTFYSTLV